MRDRILMAATALTFAIALLGSVESAYADTTRTKTLITGEGIIGARDGANHFSTDGGLTWSPAYIIQKHPAWSGPLAGTEWIGADPNGVPIDAVYRTHFNLPATACNPSLSITFLVDDAVTIYLNGTQVSGTDVGGFVFTTNLVINNPLLFQKGANELTFAVNDIGFVIAGLNYSAAVTYTVVGKGTC